jgi:uncharacterized protein YkwD
MEKTNIGSGDESNWKSNKDYGHSFEKDSNKKINTEGLFDFIGVNINELEQELGKPERVDLSNYGYQWWIYKRSENEYVQIGIENQKVVTIYATGKNINIEPFYTGQPIREIYSTYFIESILDLNYQDKTYHFELSEEDINFRPIIRINKMYVQLYIDKFSGTLSSIRIMDVPTLIKLRPFDYRELGTPEFLDEQKIDEEVLAENQEKQVFDLTNMIRLRFGLSPLEWDEQLALEGENKSKELFEKNLFSINENEEQVDRLKMGRFVYMMPGENIAVHYLDAPAVVEGWFNSDINRKNILNEKFTHVGVGVFNNYFTQKFVPDSENKE